MVLNMPHSSHSSLSMPDRGAVFYYGFQLLASHMDECAGYRFCVKGKKGLLFLRRMACQWGWWGDFYCIQNNLR